MRNCTSIRAHRAAHMHLRRKRFCGVSASIDMGQWAGPLRCARMGVRVYGVRADLIYKRAHTAIHRWSRVCMHARGCHACMHACMQGRMVGVPARLAVCMTFGLRACMHSHIHMLCTADKCARAPRLNTWVCVRMVVGIHACLHD